LDRGDNRRWGGITGNHLPGRAAWTLAGKPLPYIAIRYFSAAMLRGVWDLITGTPVRQALLFLGDLKNFGDTKDVEIPVEKIGGPVLLLAGKDDQVWPSFLMAERVMARLHRNHHPYSDQLLAYDEVGHSIPCTYVPIAGNRQRARYAVGGTPDGTSIAQADAWPRILKFLRDAANRSRTR
jgi:pimeloyl-ACP methyl ester carboxylesterase